MVVNVSDMAVLHSPVISRLPIYPLGPRAPVWYPHWDPDWLLLSS